jgi:hypothetical protein
MLRTIAASIVALMAGFAGGAAFVVHSVPDEPTDSSRVLIPLGALKDQTIQTSVQRVAELSRTLDYPVQILLPVGEIKTDAPIVFTGSSNIGLTGSQSERYAVRSHLYWSALTAIGCQTSVHYEHVDGPLSVDEMPLCRGPSKIGRWFVEFLYPLESPLSKITFTSAVGIEASNSKNLLFDSLAFEMKNDATAALIAVENVPQ